MNTLKEWPVNSPRYTSCMAGRRLSCGLRVIWTPAFRHMPDLSSWLKYDLVFLSVDSMMLWKTSWLMCNDELAAWTCAGIQPTGCPKPSNCRPSKAKSLRHRYATIRLLSLLAWANSRHSKCHHTDLINTSVPCFLAITISNRETENIHPRLNVISFLDPPGGFEKAQDQPTPKMHPCSQNHTSYIELGGMKEKIDKSDFNVESVRDSDVYQPGPVGPEQKKVNHLSISIASYLPSLAKKKREKSHPFLIAYPAG